MNGLKIRKKVQNEKEEKQYYDRKTKIATTRK